MSEGHLSTDQCVHEFRPIDSSGQVACIHCNAAFRPALVPTNDRFALPKPVTGLDLAFGGNIRDLMPAYSEVPEEFRLERDPFSPLVGRWFFSGLDKTALKAKDGIDPNAAWAHMAAVMRSWEPKHEHKTAGVAFLMSKWFEVPK